MGENTYSDILKIGLRINPRPYYSILKRRISIKCDPELLTEKERTYISFISKIFRLLSSAQYNNL